MNYNWIDLTEKRLIFFFFLAFILGTIDTPSKNDPESCGKSDDREVVNLSEQVTETTERDGASCTGGTAANLTCSVGVREENCSFQGERARAGRRTAWHWLARAESGLGGEPVSRRQVYLLSTWRLKMTRPHLVLGALRSPVCLSKSPPGHFIHSGVSICPVLSLAIKYRYLHMLLPSCHAVLGYQER